MPKTRRRGHAGLTLVGTAAKQSLRVNEFFWLEGGRIRMMSACCLIKQGVAVRTGNPLRAHADQDQYGITGYACAPVFSIYNTFRRC